jgi:hypothetical protein
MLGFGFANAAILGWLAAAAAPLLIHLWSRRQFREVPWAAIAFLLAAMRKNSRRIQLQQWILLAARTLMVVLVVLALAEPRGQNLAATISGTPTHKVLVIDTSFSMAYRDHDTTRLAEAKRQARELVDQSAATDSFTVITLADRPQAIAGRDVVDRAAVETQIDSITQSQSGANLSATLQTVAAALELSAAERQRWPRQEVYFLSDMQRATWAAATDQDEVRTEVADLAKAALIHAVDVGVPRAANLAVTDLRSDTALATTGRELGFVATLHQFGDQPRNQVHVDFTVDDETVGEQTVDIPAGGDASVHFTHRFASEGRHAAGVRASGDALDIDNTRWIVVPIAREQRVLCVAREPEDAKYLVVALAPDLSTDAAIRPQVISEGELADTSLDDFQCIFLSNVPQLTKDEADRLSGYVNKGGGLAIFLGDRVETESYNKLAAGKESLLPARLGDIRTEKQFGVDPLEYRHPIAASFRGRERSGLLTTPIARYFHLQIPADTSRATTALALPSGDPLVVTADHGRGRVVLVATAASLASVDRSSGESWTNWPAWPSFLPVVREMLAFATGGERHQWQALVGAPLAAEVPGEANSGPLELTRPDGHQVSLVPASTSAAAPWQYADTDVAGIYTLRRGKDDFARFAVNVDTRESDLAPIDPHQLPAEISVHPTWRGSQSAASATLSAVALWNRPLLWIAATLALAELCLAWLFGRGTA